MTLMLGIILENVAKSGKNWPTRDFLKYINRYNDTKNLHENLFLRTIVISYLQK